MSRWSNTRQPIGGLTAAAGIEGERAVAGLRIGGIIPIIDQRSIVIEGLLILIQLGIVLHVTRDLVAWLGRHVVAIEALSLCQVVQQMWLCPRGLERCKLRVTETIDFLSAAEIADRDMGRHPTLHQIHDIRVVQGLSIEDLIVGALVHVGRGNSCRDLRVDLGPGCAAGAEKKNAKRCGGVERAGDNLHSLC